MSFVVAFAMLQSTFLVLTSCTNIASASLLHSNQAYHDNSGLVKHRPLRLSEDVSRRSRALAEFRRSSPAIPTTRRAAALGDVARAPAAAALAGAQGALAGLTPAQLMAARRRREEAQQVQR